MAPSLEDVLDQIDDSLCGRCFDILERELNGLEPPKNALFEYLISIRLSCALFVTWMSAMPDGSEELKGCIGTLSPVPISKLDDYTMRSAFSDHRFEGLTAVDLEDLVCGLSILHSFEEAEHYKDWEIGVHGIMVSFHRKGEGYSATYLPEVAKEHNMTKGTAVRQLIKKAGYRGSVDDELLESLKVTRYQSKKLKMAYSEYKSIRS